MSKIFLVAWREFKQRVRNRGFLLTTIGLPVIFLVVAAVGGSIGGPDEAQMAGLVETAVSAQPIGYIDQANLIQTVREPLNPASVQSFDTTNAADAALRADAVSAYYVIPADYANSGQVRRVSASLPLEQPDNSQIEWLLLTNLFPDRSVQELAGLRSPFGSGGLTVVDVSIDSNAASSGGIFGDSMLPFIVAFAIMLPLFTSGSYLLYSVTQEKSSRIMEILLVSLRPRQMLTGKLIGLGALTLVQYAAWAIIVGGVLLVMGGSPQQLLGNLNFTETEILLIVPFALGGFLLYASIMAGIGALAPDIESSRTLIFVITLPMLIPLYLWMAIVSAPGSLLATTLSLIPFSAPLAMLMRMTATSVATWQLLVSLGLLYATAVGMLWLMARLFRVQTLLSGESLSAARFWQALRTA